MSLTSIQEIDLSPLPGMNYFDTEREWREEFIYFLLVDRFHDDSPRMPQIQSARTSGIKAPDMQFYGGKIKGITQNLEYIAGLGCTAIWLSPVFENNANAYHGYNIYNYLNIDPHFGTKQDLIDLVQAAHNYQKNGVPFPIRIILDAVINHSGDNWDYDRTVPNYQDDFSDDQPRQFGQWRRNPGVIPTDLGDKDYYHRRGNIRQFSWDAYPENQHGDIDGLKDYANDDDQAGSDVINILIKAHCYWIREADIDGFRVDAVKHMGELACSRFCSNVREYAYSLGKRHFFLFGELASPKDDIIDRYIGPNTSVQDGNTTVFFGINSVLDFRLAEGIYGDDNNRPLRDVITGATGLNTLVNRLDAQRERALNRGELGRYLVTFIDNHDAFWQPGGRIGALGNDDQVIAAIGFLLCSLGTACIYYGTEQGFDGHGSDNDIREAMFDQASPGKNLLNSGSRIYQEIAKIAHLARITPALRYGRIYLRQTSPNGDAGFSFPSDLDYTLAFSRILYPSEVMVAYNVSNQARQDCIIVDAALHQGNLNLSILYGGSGTLPIQAAVDANGTPTGAQYIQVNLAPHQFVILS